MVAKAAVYNWIVLQTDNVVKNPNYTGFSTPTRFFDGELGELAFGQYLWQQFVSFTRCNNMEGFPDNGDFVVQGKVINVKNTLHPQAKMLMMPNAQFEKHHADYYVGCKTKLYPADHVLFSHGICQIYGWISRDQFESAAQHVERKCPTMQVPLHLLDTIEFGF